MAPDRVDDARRPDPAGTGLVCYLSRRRGWIDPDDPHRPTSEVNLLAVALHSRVWTLDTAWDSIFHYPAPRPFTLAFRRAMTRTPLSDAEITLIGDVARKLRIELVVLD